MGNRRRKPNFRANDPKPKPDNAVDGSVDAAGSSGGEIAAGGGGDSPSTAGGDSGGTVNLGATPGLGGDSQSDGGDRPKRGRPRGSRNSGQKSEVDLTALLAENLYAFHTFLGAMTGKAIFAIEKAEADELGEAINRVASHYDIPGVNQKTVDWVRLARTLGMVYGGRMFAARMMRASNRAKPVNPVADAPQAEAPQRPQDDKARARAGGTWASPGPGLPAQWVPDPVAPGAN